MPHTTPMQRARSALAAASLCAFSACFYAHYNQVTEKKRMQAPVMREVLAERMELLQRSSLLLAEEGAGSGSGSGSGSGGAAPAGSSNDSCASGVCDLSQKRMRQ